MVVVSGIWKRKEELEVWFSFGAFLWRFVDSGRKHREIMLLWFFVFFCAVVPQ